MEFSEKLQTLRKSRGLTQEELAEALFVSRTAVSKWESGRGYPSIDSLKEISRFFAVSIDELLSGEKLISIAENENKANIRNLCELLFGTVDLFTVLAILLPLYPKTTDGFIYAVSLIAYTETSALNRTVYWMLFLLLILSGILKVVSAKLSMQRAQKITTFCSVTLSISAVLYLALAGETYAVAVIFLLLTVKSGLLLKIFSSLH